MTKTVRFDENQIKNQENNVTLHKLSSAMRETKAHHKKLRDEKQKILLSYLRNYEYKLFLEEMTSYLDLKSRFVINEQKLLLLEDNNKIIRTFIDSLLNKQIEESTQNIESTIGFLLSISPETIKNISDEYLRELLEFTNITYVQSEIVQNLFDHAYANKENFQLDLNILSVEPDIEGLTEEVCSDGENSCSITEEFLSNDDMDFENTVSFTGNNRYDNPHDSSIYSSMDL